MIMDFSKQKLAKLFSVGKFDDVIPYISDDVIWNVIGETVFIGREEVINNCKQTAEYFKSVQTEFKTHDVIVSNNKVIIIGTAEFLRNGKSLNFISACDIYEFNIKNKIEKIASYCISDKR